MRSEAGREWEGHIYWSIVGLLNLLQTPTRVKFYFVVSGVSNSGQIKTLLTGVVSRYELFTQTLKKDHRPHSIGGFAEF